MGLLCKYCHIPQQYKNIPHFLASKVYINIFLNSTWSIGMVVLRKKSCSVSLTFSKIGSQNEMFNFWKNFSFVYHQLCGFFLKNPIFLLHQKWQSHHIVPIYMKGYHDIFTLNSNLNLIKVSYLIHMFLHCIRAIEFFIMKI